jgi:hypothetical protein
VTTIVMEYGLIQPTENADIANETIRKENELYNELAEITQAGRRRYKRAEQTIPELATCHAKLDSTTAYINALYEQKSQAKSHDNCVTAPKELEIAAAKFERKAAIAALNTARARYRDQLVPIADEIYAEYGTGERGGKYGTRAAKALREHDVYWGTGLKILSAIRQACTAKQKPFMADGRPRKITPWEERPKKRAGRRLENGLVAVHIQNRVMLPGDVFGNDSFLRIDPLPANAFDPSVPRGQRKKLQRTMLHMRVGSDGRKPIWATWPLFMHQPLPTHTEKQSCKITWAVVTRTLREQRFRYEWKLQLTLEVGDAPTKLTGESVAVNLGWRRMHGEPCLGFIGPRQDGELRAATWADTAGNVGEIRLGASFRERIRRSWSIRSVRDKLMDTLQDELRAIGVSHKGKASFRRFHKMLETERAREGTPKYNAPCVALLTSWVKRDNHLHWFERGCREGALNYRRNEYRRFALFCATEYKAVVVETYDIRDISENRDKPRGSTQRVESAPSTTRDILRSTGARLGCTIIDGDSENATQACNICGNTEPWDAATAVKHTCTGCGETWDQDVNNARNMLARASVMLKTLDPLAAKKKKRRASFAKKHERSKDKKTEE